LRKWLIELTDIGRLGVHPIFFGILVVVIITNDSTVQVGRSRAISRGLRVGIGWLKLIGVRGYMYGKDKLELLTVVVCGRVKVIP
jgi:hypothetical protein